MPITILKKRARCTKCGRPLPTKCYVHTIQYNRKSALDEAPQKFVLTLCDICHARLTDRLFDSIMLNDHIDVAQHYA